MVLAGFAASPLSAVEHLVGHKVSVSKYGGNPVAGKLFKLIVKAGQQGNPAGFPLGGNPGGTANVVVIARDGGLVFDPLEAGEWKGLGKPPGSKGWKYRNKNAPSGGAVKILLVKERTIKVVAKGTGSMPAPSGSSGSIHALLQIDDARFCAEAIPGHLVEVPESFSRPPSRSTPIRPTISKCSFAAER